jgi:hypothetical protein
LREEQCAVRGIAIERSKISQAVSREGAYGVLQLRLMDQHSAAKHDGQRWLRPADCHVHRSDEVAQVSGGGIDDPPGGQVPDGRQVEYHSGMPSPVAASGDRFSFISHSTVDDDAMREGS